MSLLMEALKKAEQAKRKSAQPATDAALSAPFATPPVQEPPRPVPGADKPIDMPRREPLLTLEAAQISVPHTQRQAAEDLMTGFQSNPAPAPASPLALVLKKEAPPEIVASAAPPPEAPPPRPSVPAPPAGELPKQAPSVPTHPPSPMAKKTVLSGLRRQRRLRYGALTGVVILALIGGGYWYYYSMDIYMQQQAAKTAAHMEPPALADLPPETVSLPVPAVPSVEPAKQIETVKSPAVAPARAMPSKAKPGAPPPLPALAAQPLPSLPAVTPVIEDASALNVRRDTAQDGVFEGLNQAYAAYRGGDDARAQSLYARVLAQEEHNRDALLGMAAIAMRQKDYGKAQELYLEVLNLDPRDSVAQAGFVSLNRFVDPVEQEARVKSLLAQEPNSPPLLFIYGTLLMQQERWGEAARVLQNAQQMQREHPDYAFNVAVSFDHLGQKEGAIQYYRLALKLAEQQPASFTGEAVKLRLQKLEQAAP